MSWFFLNGIAIGRPGGSNIKIPTGLTLSLISGGVQVDWTDNSEGTTQTEIWGKSDGATYALLYTINAGVVTKNDDAVTPVDLRYYKVRAKNGNNYSDFSSEVSVAMLGADLMPAASTWANATVETYWAAAHPANWTGDGTKLISDGNSGTLTKWNFWESGSKYRIKITTQRTAGAGYVTGPYDGNTFNGYLETDVSATFTTYYTAGSVGIYIESGSYTGVITGLSVQKILFP